MADVNRGNRPLSPFMIGQVYRPQLTSVLSILHRITGCALTLAGILIVWWFIALGTGADSFAVADGVLTSWIGGLVLLGSLVALWYHFCNGLRHLVWDAGYCLDIPSAEKAGKAVIAATAVLSVITLFFVW